MSEEEKSQTQMLREWATLTLVEQSDEGAEKKSVDLVTFCHFVNGVCAMADDLDAATMAIVALRKRVAELDSRTIGMRKIGGPGRARVNGNTQGPPKSSQ